MGSTLALTGVAWAQSTTDLPQMNNYINWQMLGDSSEAGGVVTLTPNAANQRGAIWLMDAVGSTQDFNVVADVNLGTADAGGEGIAFVVQRGGISTLGSTGSGLGALGINPALVIKIDTRYDTDPDYQDPVNADLISINKGDATSITLHGGAYHSFGATDIEDGMDHRFAVDYIAATGRLRVFWDNVRVIETTIDLKADFLDNALAGYVGFTSSTHTTVTNLQSVTIQSATRGPTLPQYDLDDDTYAEDLDTDDDGDGLSDIIEGNGDTDGDGALDRKDFDSDNDGINDVREAALADADGDGEADGAVGPTGIIAGAPSSEEDSDSDLVGDQRDLDADNDGVTDLVESGNSTAILADTNGDGTLNTKDVGVTDADVDGLASVVDGLATGGDALDAAPANTDADAFPNFLDLDSDNDATWDLEAAGHDAGLIDVNDDGQIDAGMIADADNDGLPDVIDDDDAEFGGATLNIDVLARAANSVTPTAASVGGSVDMIGQTTTLLIEYSDNAAMNSAAITTAINLGAGTALEIRTYGLSSLLPSKEYHYRAIARTAWGTARSPLKTFNTTVLHWGTTGAVPGDGEVDVNLIPTNSTVVYASSSGAQYDVYITTTNLDRSGVIEILGEPSWFVEGSRSNTTPSTITVRFFEPGTLTPASVEGVRFRIEDIEEGEALSDFSFWDDNGFQQSVVFSDLNVFDYSHAPTLTLSDTRVENGAALESTFQHGKWVDVDLTDQPVSGFEFNVHRSSSGGSIVLTHLGKPANVLDFTGTFSPLVLSTGVSGDVPLPDYTGQATHTGSMGAVVTQSPAPGTDLNAGTHEVTLTLEDEDGTTAVIAFHVVVIDDTDPEIVDPGGGYTPDEVDSLTPLANYIPQAIITDNVAVTSVVQSPPAGSITSVGVTEVTITARDAAGNTAETTFNVVVVPEVVPSGSVRYSSLLSTTSDATSYGAPAGARFKTFGQPSINEDNATAFTATYAVGTKLKVGLFAGNPATLVAKQDDAAPDVSGTHFVNFNAPCLNRGTGVTPSVAFLARIMPDVGEPAIPTAQQLGLWTNVGGSLELVARGGDLAPGTGAVFKAITSVSLVEDEIVFTATLSGGVTTASDVGAWRWTVGGGGPELIIQEGDVINTMSTNKTVRTIQFIPAVGTTTGHGRHHPQAGLYAMRLAFTDGNAANYLIDGTGAGFLFEPVAQTRQSLLTDFQAATMGIPAINTSSSMAMVQTFYTPLSSGITKADNAAIMTLTGSTWEIAVRKGDPAVSTVVGWNGFTDPIINELGDIAWYGSLSASTSANGYALGYKLAGQPPEVLARLSDVAPETGGGKFKAITSIALPGGTYGPVFSATLQSTTSGVSPGPGGVTTANDLGVWGTSSAGTVKLVLREGQSLAGRTVKAFQVLGVVAGSPGQPRSFTSTGTIVFRVQFTDRVETILAVQLP
ncbi:MAG: HYR domain-containing protein [Verrucomicrobiaceae bacterium]|nr:HYR domain-containing protein [Verrucomicrobiaceae bacterium]